MFDRSQFEADRIKQEAGLADAAELRKRAHNLMLDMLQLGYAHQWDWLGTPMLQLPTDLMILQQIVWETKPDLIIETGIAWGGSVVFYASLCQLLGKGQVVAVDLNLMDHVKSEIMRYPFSDRISLYKGSSTDKSVAEKIKAHVRPGSSVMVVLDSNHTHDHVLAELRLYAPLVTKGQLLVVCDTFVDETPQDLLGQRPWGPGNNSKTALNSYLAEVDRFQEDRHLYGKAVISLMANGYMRCVK
jgi:cephalosporin hydroxylase